MRSERMSESHAKSARPVEIMGSIVTEIELLECLAFNGLYNNIIDFTPMHLDNIVEQFPPTAAAGQHACQTLFPANIRPIIRP